MCFYVCISLKYLLGSGVASLVDVYFFSFVCYCVCVCMSALNHFSCVQTLCDPYGLQPARFLCPWDSPGKNTGVGCPALLQVIFLTHGSNLHLFHLTCIGRQVLCYQHHLGNPSLVPAAFSKVIIPIWTLLIRM